jgi:hypothetical protein
MNIHTYIHRLYKFSIKKLLAKKHVLSYESDDDADLVVESIALRCINLYTLKGIRTNNLLFLRRTRRPLCHAAMALYIHVYVMFNNTQKKMETH